jgi:uncharacterized Fe-S center protein
MSTMSTKSNVYFTPAYVEHLTAENTLPPRFDRLLSKLRLKAAFAGQTVAVKIHEGTGVGFTTVRPIFLRALIEALKQAGARPFLTGGIGWPTNSKERGYTEETLGAPLFPAAGVTDRYLVPVETKDPDLPVVEICGNIAHADAMVVVSHAKGHGHCGFGGVIKNLGMGCVSRKTRNDIHRLMDTGFAWDDAKCCRCKHCVENCPAGAIAFKGNGRRAKLEIFLHDCRYCMHCVTSCPEGALTIDMSTYETFQKGLALATRASLTGFRKGKLLYINVIMDVTPLCDCWGFSSPAIIPDVGIMVSKDLVALEQATLDAMDYKKLIPGTLPKTLKTQSKRGAHLFERIHRKDPYFQVKAAARMKLGSRKYNLIEVK